MHLGEQFKMMRRAQKKKIGELAAATHINRNAIGRFERGGDLKMGQLNDLLRELNAKLIIIFET